MRVVKIILLTLIGTSVCVLVYGFTPTTSNLLSPEKDTEIQVSRYKEAHIHDPLFAFPGIDLVQLSIATEAFKRSAEVALPSFTERESIYPFRFLKTIPATESSRLAFLSTPTLDTASRYHRALLATIDAYESDITRVQSLFENKERKTYRTFSGETSTNATLRVLADAKSAAMQAREKENLRFRCLKNSFAFCKSKTYPYFLRERISTPILPVDIPNSVEENKKSLTSIYPHIMVSPIVALSNSTCYQGAPAYFAVVREVSRLSGVEMIKIVYLNDLYLDTLTQSTHPFYVAIQKAGATFTYQPFNPYLCPDMDKDVGKILSVEYLYRELSARPVVFAKGYLPPALTQLKNTQESFLSTPLLSQEKYALLIEAVLGALSAHTSSTLGMYLEGNDQALRLAEIFTMYRAQSAAFEGVVGFYDDQQVGSFVPQQLDPISIEGFVISRGGLSQLFALSNKTIHAEDSQLLSSRTTTKNLYRGLSGAQHSYVSDLSATLSRADLTRELTKDVAARDTAFSSLFQSLKKERKRQHVHR